MKKLFFIIALTLLAISCEKEEFAPQTNEGKVSVTAVIETLTKSSVTDAGILEWSTGDQISVAYGTGFHTFKNEGNSGTRAQFTAVGTPEGTMGTTAYYPANASHTSDAFSLAASYELKLSDPDTNAPMVGTLDSGVFKFNAVGGLIRFIIKNVPAGADKIVVSSETQDINGLYTVAEGKIATLKSNGTKSTSFSFDALSDAKDITFYLPLPCMSLNGIKIEVMAGDEVKASLTSGKTNEITAGKLLLMPTLKVNGTAIEKAVAEGISIDSNDAVRKIMDTVTGNNPKLELAPAKEVTSITLSEAFTGTGTSESELVLNYASAPETLVITEKTVSEAAIISKGNVKVNIDGTVEDVVVTVPNMTVSFESSSPLIIKKLTTLTAKNTLVIGENVTVENLIIKGGNMVIDGEIETWGKADGSSAEGTIRLGESAKAPETLPEGYEYDAVMTTAELTEYLTTFGGTSENAVIDINRHIVLKDGETWVPIAYSSHSSAGTITINGNGYSISGLTAPLLDEGLSNKAIVINSLTIKDSEIGAQSNSLNASGIFIGAMQGAKRLEMNDCHASNCAVVSSNYAGMTGWSNTISHITDCTIINCSFTGQSIGGISAMSGGSGDNTVSNCKIINCRFYNISDRWDKTGYLTSTINVGKQSYTNNSGSGNIAYPNDTGENGLSLDNHPIGRCLETGELYINGVRKSHFNVSKVKFSEAEESCLREVLADGGTYELTKSLNLASPLVVTATASLDLNGFNIIPAGSTLTAPESDPTFNEALIYVKAGGNLTISGTGAIDAKDITTAINLTEAGAKLTVNASPTISGHIENNGTMTLNDGIFFLHEGIKYTPADNNTVEIASADGMVYANDYMFATSGYTYKLTADIDMEDVNWASNMTNQSDFTFDGAGHTISNWTTAGHALFVPHSQYNFATIKNLTLKDCSVDDTDISGNQGAGLLFGFADNGNGEIKIDACNIIGGSVTGVDYSAGFVGYYALPAELEITNSSVKNVNIIGGGSAGAYVGHASANKESVTTIEDAIVTDCTIKGEKAEKTGIVVGTAHIGTVSITTSNLSGNTVFDVEDSDKIYGRFVPNETGVFTIDDIMILADGVHYNPKTGVADIIKAGAGQIEVAVSAGASEINLLDSGNYTLSGNLGSAKNNTGTLAIRGGEDVNAILTGSGNASGLDITMENLTWTSPSISYDTAFTNAGSVVFTKCNITGQYYAQSFAPHTFTNCKIDPQAGYLYTYGANCTFTGCTFDCSEGKSLQVFADSSNRQSTITISGCSFTAHKHFVSGAGTNVTAIDINSTNGNKFHVIVTGSTVSGFPTAEFSQSDLWNIKGGAENVTVTINGSQVYPTE